MITAKVTSKGQVTIPKKIRERLGINPGEGIRFEEKDGVMLITKERSWVKSLSLTLSHVPDIKFPCHVPYAYSMRTPATI